MTSGQNPLLADQASSAKVAREDGVRDDRDLPGQLTRLGRRTVDDPDAGLVHLVGEEVLQGREVLENKTGGVIFVAHFERPAVFGSWRNLPSPPKRRRPEGRAPRTASFWRVRFFEGGPEFIMIGYLEGFESGRSIILKLMDRVDFSEIRIVLYPRKG